MTTLTDLGGATTVSYSVDSTLADKLGSIGQPVLRAKAKEMERQFASRLRAVLGPATDELVR
jgi:carbon monoxide dehydrogenase subunit G